MKWKDLLHRGSEHYYFVGATIISAGIHFLYSIYVKAHIEPVEQGIYSTCLLLQTYLAYVQLGSLNAFNRDYPQLIGARDKEKAEAYRNTTFSFLLLVFTVSTLIISVVVLFANRGGDGRYTYGLIFCSLITTVTVIESFLSSRVRIDGSFKYTSIVILFELVSVVVGFFLIPKMGYYALYIVSIGSMLIGICMYYGKGISTLRIRIDWKLLKVILISGLPLLVNSLIWTVVDSIDKFVILGFIDTEALGIYSIAQMSFSYMVLIPNAMSQLFYVRLGKIYGSSNSTEELNNVAGKYTLIIAIVISYILMFAFYFIQPVVEWIMPKYSGGVDSAKILIVALAFYAPTMVNGNILTILKKNAALLRGSIYLCLLNAFCSTLLVLVYGPTIENVAIGTGISYFVRTVILVIQLKREAGTSIGIMLKASIVPVIIISGPGVLLYYTVENMMISFIISIVIASLVTYLVFNKNIKEILVVK